MIDANYGLHGVSTETTSKKKKHPYKESKYGSLCTQFLKLVCSPFPVIVIRTGEKSPAVFLTESLIFFVCARMRAHM